MVKREVQIFGDFAIIPLTKGFSTIIDIEDVDLVKNSLWRAHIETDKGYAVGGPPNEQFALHRMLMGFPDCEVDHKDDNGLNNRRSNLRLATRAQNTLNRRIQKNNDTGFKGVTFDKSRNKYLAGVKKDYVRYNLGRYDDPADAAKAYDRKAIELHGEFAYTNFPRSDYD